MTVNDIYVKAVAMALETPEENSEYEDFAIIHLNLLLQELFRHNNVARERNGKEPLTTAPVVTAFEEENPYEWQFNNALVYGLAAKLFIASEQGLEGTYQQLYYAAVNSALPAEWEQVEDYYAAGNN